MLCGRGEMVFLPRAASSRSHYLCIGLHFYFTGSSMQAWQYGHRFLVDLNGVEVTLERDDAGEFRAILPEGFSGKTPDKAVINAIIQVLQAL